MWVPPFAKIMKERMPTRGQYKKGWPVGAVIHYTAGRDGAENTIKGGIKNGYAYWCIQRDGHLFAAHSAESWGYHAGKSAWRRLVGGVNDDLIGIEINTAGTVKPSKTHVGFFDTYFKTQLPASDVRAVPANNANQAKGFYHKYTPEQEKTLVDTLMWLKAQKPDIFDFDFVLGHDEVSGPLGIGYWRKVDPGGALSMTMPELRVFLKHKWAALNAKA